MNLFEFFFMHSFLFLDGGKSLLTSSLSTLISPEEAPDASDSGTCRPDRSSFGVIPDMVIEDSG
jgi:hypothetical protein